jgi:hypothetical protein
MFAGVAGTLDDRGDEVDPVLRKVVAVVPSGIRIDALAVSQGNGIGGELLARNCRPRRRRT